MLPILKAFRDIFKHWCAWHFIMLTVRPCIILPHISGTVVTGTKPLLSLHLDMWQLQMNRHNNEEIFRYISLVSFVLFPKSHTQAHSLWLCWWQHKCYCAHQKAEYQNVTHTCNYSLYKSLLSFSITIIIVDWSSNKLRIWDMWQYGSSRKSL